jgi:hypothetical protein
MKLLVLLLWTFIPPESGYRINGDNVIFYYSGKAEKVFVSDEVR